MLRSLLRCVVASSARTVVPLLYSIALPPQARDMEHLLVVLREEGIRP